MAAPSAAQLVVDPGIVVNTIETSLWAPPSPDPSGVTYRPDTGELLVCDAEVEETVGGITLYQGVNVWTVTRTGTVTSTYTTVGRSNEPTGIAWDPAGGRLWYSDDVRGSIFQVDFGPDDDFDTSDDVTRELRNLDDAGCGDMEDVTYNSFDGHLYFTVNSTEMCKLGPGANAVFDGVPPQGDDVITVIDVPSSPFTDPEGIVYDPFWNTLVIADRGTRDLYEITPEGGVLRRIDVAFPGGVKPAGVTIAPGTTNPMLRNYYVVDRRVDNDADPTENDGRLFEIVAVPLGGNGAPIVDAGPPQSLEWPANTADLNGFVGDDGHPYPPSAVTALWSKQSGPGTVSFGNPNQPVTTASFSAPGTYVLQLVGNDSDLQTLDTVTITFGQTVSLSVVTNGPGSVTLDPPGGSYSLGQVVTVTATPNAGAGFVGFSGSLSGNASPQQLTMDADEAVTATFATLLNLSVATTGPGSVTLSPPGGSYLPGTPVTLTAVPGLNAAFTGWSGGLGGSDNPAQLVISADTAVDAAFVQLHSVATAAVGPGSVSISPSAGPYPAGSTVTLTATPGPDATFVGWSGDLSGTTSPESLLVDADKSVTGTFATLFDVTASATGPGTIALDPPGGTYPAGTIVTVTATPDAGAAFTGFSGDLTGTTTPQPLTVDGDKTVAAAFAQQLTLSVAASGPGSVTLEPPGGVYTAGTSVTVTAVPGADAAFVGWSGDLTGLTNPQVVVVNTNTSATASFAALFDVAASATGPGTIALDPPGGTYPAGTIVTVTATPDAGAAFTGFSGDLTGTTTPQPLTVDGDKTVAAAFAQQLTLSVAASGPGTVTLEPPGGVYTAGTSVTVTAVPGADAAFVGWSGDLTGTTNPQVVVVNANTSATASFAALFDVAASATGPGTIALDPPGGTYPAGTIVTVSATPEAGGVFLGFSGDLSGTTTPQPLTVDGDRTVNAAFSGQVTLSVAASGPGSVVLDPPGGVYLTGTPVTVTALPELDAAFLGWSGDLGGTTNPLLVVVNTSLGATATFAPLFEVAASATGPGTIALDPPGGIYPAGTIVTVTAAPDAGAAFTGFSGDLAGTTTPQLLTVDADKTVVAGFEPIVTHTLTVTTSANGSVTVDPPGGVYPAGTIVTLTAVPVNVSFRFTGWSGDATGTANPIALVMDADQAVHATFGSSGQQPPACGIGPELAALVPALGWLYRRRKTRG